MLFLECLPCLYIEILFLFPLELCVTPPHFLVGSWSCMDQKVIHHRTSLKIGILSQCTSSGLLGMVFFIILYVNKKFPRSEDITLSLVICPPHHVGIAGRVPSIISEHCTLLALNMLKLFRHLKELWHGSLNLISVCDHAYLMFEIITNLFFFSCIVSSTSTEQFRTCFIKNCVEIGNFRLELTKAYVCPTLSSSVVN